MKKFSFLVLLSVILFSANTMIAQDMLKAKPANETQMTVVTPEKFQDFAAENIGKEVEIQGMVIHVCKHGGKKMFLIGEDPDKRVKITTSEKIDVFEPDFEGSTVVVKGIVEPIVEEILPEEEKHDVDADHTNYYHVPQFAISCLSVRLVEE